MSASLIPISSNDAPKIPMRYAKKSCGQSNSLQQNVDANLKSASTAASSVKLVTLKPAESADTKANDPNLLQSTLLADGDDISNASNSCSANHPVSLLSMPASDGAAEANAENAPKKQKTSHLDVEPIIDSVIGATLTVEGVTKEPVVLSDPPLPRSDVFAEGCRPVLVQNAAAPLYTVKRTEPDLVLLPACLCRVPGGKTTVSDIVGKTCQAIDSFSDKLYPCSGKIESTCLMRAAVRLPFGLFCDAHQNRLNAHYCCPMCGVFCIEGTVFKCKSGKTPHFFHKECLSFAGGCPHCHGRAVKETNLEIATSLIDGDSVKTQVASRMAITPECPISALPPQSKSSSKKVECSIPGNGHKISSEYLTFGALREDFEKVLQAVLSVDRTAIKSRCSQKQIATVVRSGDVAKLVHMLIIDGVSANFKTDSGDSLLCIAAEKGHFLCVYALLQAGADLTATDKKRQTPLHLALSKKHSQVAQLLIRAGADLEFQNEQGETPLHIAAKTKNFVLVEIVVNSLKRARPSFSVDPQDNGGWTPLMNACEFENVDIAEFLLKNGASTCIQDKEGNVALHWAAYSGFMSGAELLLERYGVIRDLFATNNFGDTPLHSAARQEGSYNVVVYFMLKGADPHLKNQNGQSALDVAAAKNVKQALRVKQDLTKERPEIYEKVVASDLSKGRENVRIPVVNGVDSDNCPEDFAYIRTSILGQGVVIESALPEIDHCQCTDFCTSNCGCSDVGEKLYYTENGLLIPEVNFRNPPVIFECNDGCRCSIQCRNRVVQKGISVRVELFKTTGVKGWGVRTLQDLKRGQFVAEYLGEILHEDEVARRTEDRYFFDLDSTAFNSESLNYTIDGKHFGNITRFFNHSCTPNIIPVKVFVNHLDVRFPRIAFFAMQEIGKYQELCFDYGNKYWIVKGAEFLCQCGSTTCKYDSKAKIELLIQQEIDEQVNKKNVVAESNAV